MKEHSGTEKGNRFMLKLARGIVDKRKLIFLFTLLLLIFSVFSSDCRRTPRPGRGWM